MNTTAKLPTRMHTIIPQFIAEAPPKRRLFIIPKVRLIAEDAVAAPALGIAAGRHALWPAASLWPDGIRNGVNLKLLSLCMGHVRTQMTEHYVLEAGLTEHVQQAAWQVAYGARTGFERSDDLHQYDIP